jgi:uncharacterized protein (TIGR02996 family)
LLAAVLANPRDDAPRAVLGDWLGERGDPRGELITLQLAVRKPALGAGAKIYRERDEQRTEQQDEQEARIMRILRKHQAEWIAPFRQYLQTWRWRRGFVDSFTADATLFAEGLTEIATRTPIADLNLTGLQKGMLPKLFARAELMQVEKLGLLQQRIGPVDARVLGTAPLVALRDLHLAGNPLGDAGVAAIVASPHLVGLEMLDLQGCGLSEASLVALSNAPCLATLQVLNIWDLRRDANADADTLDLLLSRAKCMRDFRLYDRAGGGWD